MVKDASTVDGACANCGERLHGKFCTRCGQEDRHIDRTSVGQLLREWLDDAFGLDSRLLRTMVSLVGRPGFLTQEYLEGRRVRYVRPLRLFIISSIAAFLMLGLFGARLELTFSTPPKNNPSPAAEPVTEASSEPAVSDASEVGAEGGSEYRVGIEDSTDLGSRAFDRLPQAMFFLAPVFALFVKLLHRRRVPFYIPHLIFALHVLSFWFLLLIVGLLVDLPLPEELNIQSLIAFVGMPVYLLLAQKRVYGAGWFTNLWKTALLLVAQVLALIVVFVALVAVTAALG